ATSRRYPGRGNPGPPRRGLRRLHLAFTANHSRFRTATASRKADLNVPKLTVASDKIGDYRANCVWAGADRTSGNASEPLTVSVWIFGRPLGGPSHGRLGQRFGR